MSRARHLALFAVACTVVACGDEDHTDLGSVEAGIYEVSHWTTNDSVCTEEGPSILEDHWASHVVIGHIEDEYESFIVLQPCADRAACADRLAEVANGGWTYAELLEGNVDDGFAARTAGRTGTGDICRDWVEDATLTTNAGTAHFERRTRYLDKPRTGLFCDLFADHPGDDAPCRELEVLTATRVEPLGP